MKTIKAISILLAVATFAIFSNVARAGFLTTEQASYTYDDNNRLTQVSYSNNRKVIFTYDNNGNLTNVATSGVTGNTVVFSSGGNGKINGTTQQTVLNGGSTTPVTAIPDADYHFVDWTNPNYTLADNPLILTNVTDSTAFTANFAHNTGTITVNAVGDGTVGGGGLSLDTNTPQTITASANPGSSFINWTVSGEGSISSTTASTATVTLTGLDGCVFNATANFFNAATNTVAMSSIGGGSYSGSISPLTDPTPGNIIVYKVSVPAGQKFLTATLTNMNGDADLYTKFGGIPSLQNYNYKSDKGANINESITIANPGPDAGDWYFMVYAYNAYSGITFTATYGTAAQLAAPTLSTASQNLTDKVTLTWEAATGATSYDVYRSIYNSAALAEKIGSNIGNVTTWDDTTAVSGSYYYYWVKSRNGGTESDFSNTKRGWLANTPAPLANGISVSAIASTTAGITKRYQITTPAGIWKLLEIKTTGVTGDCDLTVEKGGDVLKYGVKPTCNETIQIENPLAGDVYVISIYANTPYSGVSLNAKFYNTAPLPPTMVNANDGIYTDTIAVNWKESAGATSYEVWRSPTTLATNAVKLGEVTDISYVDISNPNNVLLNTATYYYFVKAKNGAGTSAFSASNSGNLARIPAAPATVAASDGTYFDRIRVTWGAVTGATSYEVYRSTGATSLFSAATKIADVDYVSYNTTYTYDDMGSAADPKTAAVIPIYKYWIKANNSNGSSAEKGDTGYIKNTAPAGTMASNGTYYNQVKITWTAAPGATGYNVYRKTTVATISGATATNPCVITATAHGFDGGETALISGITGTMSTLLNAKKLVISKIDDNSFSVPVDTTGKSYTSGGIATVTPVTTPNPTKLNLLPVTENAYYDTTAAANVTYAYWVDADYNGFYQSNLSLNSNGKAATAVPATLTAPILKSVSNGESNSVKIVWTEVPMATSYTVYRKVNTVDPWVPLPAATNITALSIDDTPPNTFPTKYMYCVKAFNGAKESPYSATLTGYRTGAFVTFKKGDAPLTVTGAYQSQAIYKITIPSGCSRLVATLTPLAGATGDCDMYAKFNSYPTTLSYNTKGVEGVPITNETLTVTNPTAGDWYILLYGASTATYSNIQFSVTYYMATNIVITLVPADDQIAPMTPTFKGQVVDEDKKGIPGLTVGVRNPLTGLTFWITTKTDLNGYFTYSTQLCADGEYTFDFYLSTIPDNTTSIASYTVKTRRAPSGVFDFAGYIPATIATLSKTDVGNLQSYMNARRGFANGTLALLAYESLWIDNTLLAASADSKITAKLDSGLYMLYYGTESAAVGNCGTTVSADNLGLKTTPLLVRVASGSQEAVFASLSANGLIDNALMENVRNGGIGVVVVTAVNNPDETGVDYDCDISLYSDFQMDLLANIAGNTYVTPSATPEKKYADKVAKCLDIVVDAEGVAKKIGVQVYTFTE